MCTKDWFVVVRSEGIELFQVCMELRSDIPEVNFCININYSTGLFRQNMFCDIGFKTTGEFFHISTFMDSPAA